MAHRSVRLIGQDPDRPSRNRLGLPRDAQAARGLGADDEARPSTDGRS